MAHFLNDLKTISILILSQDLFTQVHISSIVVFFIFTAMSICPPKSPSIGSIVSHSTFEDLLLEAGIATGGYLEAGIAKPPGE